MKKITKVCYLILGSLFFVSCSQKENRLEPKRTVIAGVVENFSDNANALVVYFCNPLSDEEQFVQSLIKSKGCFQAEHEYIFAQNLTIRFAGRSINLFVHPGDSVFVSIDGAKIESDFANAVTFSGDNSKLNKELYLWCDYSYNTIPTLFDYYASPEDFLASVKKTFDIAQDSIRAYAKKNGMSNSLRKWAFIDHKFSVTNHLMHYNAGASTWDVFTNAIFDVFNENNFQTMYFPIYLSVCMNTFIESDAEILRLFTEKKHAQVFQLIIKRLHEKVPKGIVRDMMLFSILKNGLTEMPELYDALPEIKIAFSQKFFNKKLDEIVKKNKVPGQALSETLLNTDR